MFRVLSFNISLFLSAILMFAAMLCVAGPARATGELTPSQREAFREFSAATSMHAMFDQIFPTLKKVMMEGVSAQIAREMQNRGDIPQKKIDAAADIAAEEILAALEEAFPREIDSLLDEMAVVYYAHFSEDEIREMTIFFQTPTGEKMSRLQGRMFQEGAKAGERWGAQVPEKSRSVYGPAIKNRLREELGIE